MVLSQLDADIVALQEVLLDQAQCFARKLKQPHIFAAARIHRGRDYGNVLFTRFPVTRTENHDITVSGREERKCLEAEIQIPGRGAIHVFAVHLGTSWSERRQQARKLLAPALLGRSDPAANPLKQLAALVRYHPQSASSLAYIA